MRIGARQIGPDHEPFIIAEIGVNHDGSVDRALELVEVAARAGADAVKLQLFRANRLLSREAPLAAYQKGAGSRDAFEMLRSLELSIDAMRGVAGRALELGLEPIVTVFSVELVAEAATIGWRAFKTASPDIVNRPLLQALRSTGRPLIISTGTATMDEVRRAMGWLEGHPHAVLQCVSAYPTPEEDACLGGIEALSQAIPAPVGYSDHTTAVDTGALAVAAGACILEKHVTRDPRADGPDHASSLDPDQLAEYIRLARRAHTMRGPAAKVCRTIEEEVRRISRQSVVATRSMEPGHVIRSGDLTIKRPGTGIEPWRLDELIGRRTRRSVEADATLVEADLAPAGEPQRVAAPGARPPVSECLPR